MGARQTNNALTRWILVAACVLMAATSVAWAHGSHHQRPDGPWWLHWRPRPEILIGLGALALLYFRGVHRLWRRAGRGRGVSTRRPAIFLAAMFVLLLALVSPIDVLGEQLGSMHMVQHMLLVMVAAPLLVLGSVGQAIAWSLPKGPLTVLARSSGLLRRIGMRRYVIWQPILMWSCFALLVWLLHFPKLYESALRNRALHDLQHIAFVVSACLFWRVMLDPISSLRISPALGVLYLFTMCLQCAAIGVFMAFSSAVWYSDYLVTAPLWGIDPLRDQQIAGYIMWIPGCFIYALFAAVVFGRWLQEPTHSPRDEPVVHQDVRGVTESS